MDFSEIRAFWKVFVYMWAAQFGLTLASALIANGLFAVPIHQVSNTIVAILLFWVYLAMTIGAIGALILLFAAVRELEFSPLLAAFLILISYALLPFASILAFSLYAWLGHLKLDGAFVSADYIKHIVGALRFVAGPFKGVLADEGSMKLIETVGRYLSLISLLIAWLLSRAKPKGEGLQV